MMKRKTSSYCRRCGTHESQHDADNACPEFIPQPELTDDLDKRTMKDGSILPATDTHAYAMIVNMMKTSQDDGFKAGYRLGVEDVVKKLNKEMNLGIKLMTEEDFKEQKKNPVIFNSTGSRA